mgnify:CR=1 FL=1
MRTKPSGIKGPLRIQVVEGGAVVSSFEQIPFSSNKADLEKGIVDKFFLSMNKGLAKSGEKFLLLDPQQNEENDFDFTVTSPDGPAYLELMEIAPLQGPHEHAPVGYRPYDFAQAIFDGIHQKSQRYPKNMIQDLYLLLYVTHWTDLPPIVIPILMLSQKPMLEGKA